MRPHRCTNTSHTHTHHTHTQSRFSVTVQNPCLRYLETGVDFLMYISEGLYPRARGPLSASAGRLAPVTLMHTHTHTHTQTKDIFVFRLDDFCALLWLVLSSCFHVFFQISSCLKLSLTHLINYSKITHPLQSDL